MKLWMIGAAGLLATSACFSAPQTKVMIDCGATDVLMSGETANAIRAKTGDAQFGSTVCSVVKQIDASTFVRPTQVTAHMPTGESYKVDLQISQQ